MILQHIINVPSYHEWSARRASDPTLLTSDHEFSMSFDSAPVQLHTQDFLQRT